MIGEVKVKGELGFKAEKQSRMGTLKSCAKTLKNKAHTVASAWRNLEWLSSSEHAHGFPGNGNPFSKCEVAQQAQFSQSFTKATFDSGNTQRNWGSALSENRILEVPKEARKTWLEFAHRYLVPEARAGGWWTLSLPCKQQQCCLWGCSPGFPHYCPSYHLQLSPDRMPVGHRLVIKNVLFITTNVSLSAETKEPQTQGKGRTLPSSAGSRL